jgi:hypothetical protein
LVASRARVEDRDGRVTPAPAPQQPPPDAEVLAQPPHVRDQVVGRVGRQVGSGVAGVRGARGAAPAAALVELDDQVGLGIEEPPPPRR